MYKQFLIISLTLASCSHSDHVADHTPATVSAPTVHHLCMPPGFTVIEQSPDNFFIRLSSAERASSTTISQLSDSLSGTFGRIDLCLNFAQERGDEYASIIGSQVFDYQINNIYSLK